MAASVRSSTKATGPIGTSLVIAKPSGAVAGDILYMFVATDGVAASDLVFSISDGTNGFTGIGPNDSGRSVQKSATTTMAVWRRVVTGAEGANFTITYGSGSDNASASAMCVCVQDAHLTTPEDIAPLGNDGGAATSTSVVAPSISPTTTNSLLLSAFASDLSIAATSYTIGTMTEMQDIATASRTPLMTAYQQLSASGATSTRTATANAAQEWVACSVAVRSAPTQVASASPGAATATTFVFTTATTLGHTPATGNLVTVQLRRLDETAVTGPSGWTRALTVDSSWGTANTELWYRVFDGTESATYTWTFASTSRGAVVREFTDSVAGSWVQDVAVATTPGSGSVNSLQLTTTGTLANAVEVVHSWMTANASLTSPTVDSGFVGLDSGLPQGLDAYKVTAVTTALTPTFSWGGSARAPHVGGQVSFYRNYSPTVTAVLAAPLGALTAAATADFYHPAVLAAPLGGLTAAAAADLTHPATLAAPLGGLSGTASAVPEHAATLAAPLGSLAVAATATPDHPATLAAPLGGLTATAVATPEHPAILAAPLGGLSASAVADVTSGTTTVDAVLAAPLGGLVASASAGVDHPATLAAPLGSLAASAVAVVEDLTATASAPLGGLVATATADLSHPAVLSSDLGGLTASASASLEHAAQAQALLGALVATAQASVELAASGSAPLGSLSATASASVTQAAVLTALLGELVASATATTFTPAPPLFVRTSSRRPNHDLSSSEPDATSSSRRPVAAISTSEAGTP